MTLLDDIFLRREGNAWFKRNKNGLDSYVGGYLLLGDFLPDFPQRRVYHHYNGRKLYTYKQD